MRVVEKQTCHSALGAVYAVLIAFAEDVTRNSHTVVNRCRKQMFGRHSVTIRNSLVECVGTGQTDWKNKRSFDTGAHLTETTMISAVFAVFMFISSKSSATKKTSKKLLCFCCVSWKIFADSLIMWCRSVSGLSWRIQFFAVHSKQRKERHWVFWSGDSFQRNSGHNGRV